MHHGTLEKSIWLEKSFFNLIWLRMIKNYPTQSSIDVVVSGVAEKINDVKRRVGHKKARKWLRHDANDDAIIHL